MKLKSLSIDGFKSFGKKSTFQFKTKKTAIVGPNGSGKSNVVEAIRFVLGEQSMKSLRSGSASDLLFRGVKDNAKIARITLQFDNSDGSIVIPSIMSEHKKNSNELWSEIIIERVISDEGSSYILNGSEVRLKDIQELLLGMHIGSSGYHIINQGEADRLLLASPRERRVMLEEALGLRLIAGRIKESERKLEKTRENLISLTFLQKELSPELNYLKKQVEKIKEAEQNRNSLFELSQYYLQNETILIKSQENLLESEVLSLNNDIIKLSQEVAVLKEIVEFNPDQNSGVNDAIRNQEHIIETVNNEMVTLSMDERSLKTHVALLERDYNKYVSKRDFNPDPVISLKQSYVKNIYALLTSLFEKPSNMSLLKNDLEKIIQYLSQYINLNIEPQSFLDDDMKAVENEIAEKKNECAEISRKIEHIEKTIAVEKITLRDLHDKKEQSFSDIRVKQSLYFSKKDELTRLEYKIMSSREKIDNLKNRKTNIEEERRHFEHISAHSYVNFVISEEISDLEYDPHKTKRALEKLVFKIEEVGGGSGVETINEYEDLQARYDNYYIELIELRESSEKIEGLIKELSATMKLEFESGMEKVSGHFQDFFTAMFGGGTARIVSVVIPKRAKDEVTEDIEEGIDIELTLPKKQTQSLTTLSGGERSLTSIALLFALSQINPPPFLILDETDAALDEANSKRYGDMLERLSEYSQIIVVTHNRETMSRADVLYGVTLEKNGSSMLLSVSFHDAAQYAK